MATARCYTKSGSVEKYESNLWKSPIAGNWSSTGILGTITTPDSNGNYTVTPEKSFEDSSVTTTYSCFTEYGGVKKTFYFKKKIVSITIRVSISLNGYNNNGCVAFSCSVSGYVNGITNTANNKLANNILGGSSVSLSWKVVTPAGPFGSYTTSITSTGSLILNTGANYVTGTQYYIDVGDEPYCSPSSGKFNEYNWDTYVFTATN